MEHSSERRKYQRHLHKSSMDLYRMDYQENSYYAEMIDYCDKGLSLKTNEKLVLGELIHVKLKKRDPNLHVSIKKQTYSGIVRWGKRYHSTNAVANGRYKYGIEFSTNNH